MRLTTCRRNAITVTPTSPIISLHLLPFFLLQPSSLATVASSNLLQTVHSTTQSLLGEPAADILDAVIANATRTWESLLQSLNLTSPASKAPLTWQDKIYDFLASRSSLESTSILLALSTFLFLFIRNIMSMSWTSRFNNLGRFSPFTRSPQGSISGPTQVSDADFSYITADDLRKHQAASVSAVTDGSQSESPTDLGPERETDVLVLRNKRQDHWVHFPAYSIAKGELRIKEVREAAAKKLSGGDTSRIKLLYKGKNLKDDSRTAKQEGLRDESELLVAVAERDADSEGESESEDGDERADAETGEGEGGKKRRNRGKRTKRRNKREAAAAASEDNSRTQSPKPPPTPLTPLDKLKALHDTLVSFQPQVDAFVRDPPSEQAKKDFEHKRLTETIFTKVQLKLDEVSTEGDEEARMRRKELVKETQGVLAQLDAVMKK